MVGAIVQLLAVAARVAVEVIGLVVKLVAAYPLVALGVLAVVVFAELWSAVAFAWLLILGLVLLGAGLRLRTQGL
jgi:hypothetical protein